MLISHPSIMWTHSSTWTSIERLLCSFLSLFPKVFVTSLMTWALWAITSQLHTLSYKNTALAIAYVLYGLSIFTYFRVIYEGPGTPYDFPELRLPPESEPSYNNDEYQHPYTRENPGPAVPPTELYTTHTFKDHQLSYHLCRTCNTWKPDRCHHCKTCKSCILKMDHHCPWFACCIGFRNHKFFIQSLCYITSFCGWLLLLSGHELYRFFADQDFDLHSYLLLNLVFVVVLSFTFFIAVGVFTAFLVYLLLRNYTTIEFQNEKWNYSKENEAQYEFDSRGKRRKLGHIYDLGLKNNLRAVMGDSWAAWVMPIKVTSMSLAPGQRNGIDFEVNEATFEKLCNNAKLQEQLDRQLAEYRDRLRGSNE